MCLIPKGQEEGKCKRNVKCKNHGNCATDSSKGANWKKQFCISRRKKDRKRSRPV